MIRKMPGTKCRAKDCSRQGGLRWESYAFWCGDHRPGDDR